MTIIMRSALVAWGRNPPPDLAYVKKDHRRGQRIYTWDDVLRERREHQARILANKRRHDPWRAYKLWVAYFDQDIFGGWHAFLQNRRECIWICHSRCWWPAEKLMELFPLTLPIADEMERWERWLIEFARRFKRRTQCRRPLGVHYLWFNGRDLRLPLTGSN